MATKTFKIGLSNTDKQNMAQEVYERLLALTFPEYETTESYDVGDFVVYNDQLYKCIGATTGAWDSSKWQLATLNDLLTDIEDAVAFVNDKANVDGNYPTMTVGFADALTPYDSDSGDDQDEPFSFQATGTGNGTQPDFATGSTALMKEKRGNSVVVNNYYRYAGWSTNDATISKTDDIITIQLTAYDGYALQNISSRVKSGDKILTMLNIKGANGITYRFNGMLPITVGDGSWKFLAQITTINELDTGFFVLSTTETSDFQAFQIKDDMVFVNLTQWFNGDIPQDLLDNPENFFRYYQGSLAYNAGTLVNANGRYVKCIGRNQWDEEWESGLFDYITGANIGGDGIRSKLFKVIPNAIYTGFVNHSGSNIWAMFYDKDTNIITPTEGTVSGNVLRLDQNTSAKIPSNAVWCKFYVTDYGTTYNHDITISLYYEDESGYDQYYPYEVLTNNDTGTETLRSAGNVADIKLPSGEITRKVASVDLSTLTWAYDSSQLIWYATMSNAKGIGNNSDKANIISSKYDVVGDYYVRDERSGTNAIALVSDGTLLFVANGSSTTEPTGTLFYELATPTEEQGTPYSENLFIDDFGSMDFAGTNGVPQGNLIFYPVDYKAFIDTLYNYTDGTPSELAKKSDLSADKSELQGVDTQLKNAIGGTLRHLISGVEFNNSNLIDLGDLAYTRTGSGLFQANSIVADMKAPADNETPANIVCTKYQTYKFNVMYGPLSPTPGPNMAIAISTTGYIYINDSSYTDATTFKNSLKGVLLAYEKGE